MFGQYLGQRFCQGNLRTIIATFTELGTNLKMPRYLEPKKFDFFIQILGGLKMMDGLDRSALNRCPFQVRRTLPRCQRKITWKDLIKGIGHQQDA